MKRIALLGLVALLAACDSTNPAAPVAAAPRMHAAPAAPTHGDHGAAWQRFSFPVREVRQVACLNEPVLLDGVIDMSVRTVVDGQGRRKIQIAQKATGISQRGLVSGTVWTATAAIENFTYHIQADGHLRMYQHTGVIQFHADRTGAPNLSLKHFVHVQLDANGEVRVERTTEDVLECHDNGPALQ